MYCGAAVPEKCVGNGSYFKKKKIWIFFSLSKSLPRGRDVATDTAEYTTALPLGRNRSMIFLARSLAAVSPTTAD